MFDPPLTSLKGLTNKQHALIKRAGLLTAEEILLPPIQQLQNTLKPVQFSDVETLVEAVAAAIQDEPVNMGLEESDEQEGCRFLDDVVRFGDGIIDNLLGGGIRKKMITEVVGESAAGKTQFALQTSIAAQIPYINSNPGGVAYVSSEGNLPIDRVNSLCQQIVAAHSEKSTSTEVRRTTAETIRANIHFTYCTDVEAVDHIVSYILPALIDRLASAEETPDHTPKLLPISLIVLDSLAALLRATHTNSLGDLAERSNLITSLADKFRAISNKYNIAVLVINQVSDVFSSESFSFDDGLIIGSSMMRGKPELVYKEQAPFFSGAMAGDLKKEAALGLVWANCVNTRVLIARTRRVRRVGLHLPKQEDMDDENAAENGKGSRLRIRKMDLVFSPCAPVSSIDYVVTEAGMRGLQGEECWWKRSEPLAVPVKRQRAEEDDVDDAKGSRGSVVVDEFGFAVDDLDLYHLPDG